MCKFPSSTLSADPIATKSWQLIAGNNKVVASPDL